MPSGFVPETPTMIVLDGTPHTQMRKAVQRAFTPQRVVRLRSDTNRGFEQLVVSL